MQAPKGDGKKAPKSRPAASLAVGLAAVFTDFEVVDEDLDLGEERRVQLVGTDAAGRLVLVLLVQGDGVEPILAALDAISFVQRNRGVLANHFQSARLRPEVAPVIALVSEGFSDKLLGRLSGLSSELVRLFELRKVSSARGEHTYLAPIAPGSSREAIVASRASETFVRALPAAQRELADLSLRRIGRIDDQLVSSATEAQVTWRMAGELVCCLMSVDDRLEGQVPPDGRPRRIASVADVEAFVDEALKRYVGLLEEQQPARPQGEVGLPEVDPGPLLSPEEIEAFRQPG